MSKFTQQLRQLVNTIHPLEDEVLNHFLSVWVPIEYKRKEVITVANEKEKYLYFVCDGVQRVYYLNDEGKEATLVFTYAPSFGGVFDAFLQQTPSRYYYETLTASVFLRASFADVQKLMQLHHAVETFMRKGITAAASGLMERITELQCFSAEERFRVLLKRSPHILQLVPHKYLANYLGMDATNFSKLLNRIRI